MEVVSELLDIQTCWITQEKLRKSGAEERSEDEEIKQELTQISRMEISLKGYCEKSQMLDCNRKKIN
jgi:hypothetical protein